MIVHTYTEPEGIPLPLLQQFRAMRIRRYYTIKTLLGLWKAGAPGLVTFVIAPPNALEGPTKPADAPPDILAWCFIVRVPKKRGDVYSDRFHLATYVRQGFRKQGLGRQAVLASTSLAEKLWPAYLAPDRLKTDPYVVYPHDEASKAFMKAKRLLP